MIKYSFCHPLGSDQHLCNFCSGGERGERVQRGHDCSCAFSQPITESTLHLGHFLQLPSLLLQLRTLPQYHRCVSSSSISLSVQLSVCLTKSLLYVPSSHPASLCLSSCLYVSPRACCVCHHPIQRLSVRPAVCMSHQEPVVCAITLTVIWPQVHPPLHLTSSPMYSPSLSRGPQFTHLCIWPFYPCTHLHCHMTPNSPTSAHDLVTHVLTLTVIWPQIHPHLHMTLLLTLTVIWPQIHPSLHMTLSLSLSSDPIFTHLHFIVNFLNLLSDCHGNRKRFMLSTSKRSSTFCLEYSWTVGGTCLVCSPEAYVFDWQLAICFTYLALLFSSPLCWDVWELCGFFMVYSQNILLSLQIV